jgi:tetratricopeptide (TPR) repeat protein
MYSGYVYILLNASLHNNVIKIGMTTRTPEIRAQELSEETGLPSEYIVAYEKKVADCVKAEALIHSRLKKYRITHYRYDRSREFFKIPLKEAILIVDEIASQVGDPLKEVQRQRHTQRDPEAKVSQNQNSVLYYKEKVQNEPENASAHFFLGFAIILHVLGLNDNDGVKYGGILNEEGKQAESERLLKEAIESFNQAIRINSEFNIPQTHCYIGKAYNVLKQYNNAIEAFKQSIQMGSPNELVESYSGIGLSYSKLGQFEDAIKSYKHAIQISPDHALSHFNLGLTLIMINADKNEVLEHYNILKNLDGEFAKKLFKHIENASEAGSFSKQFINKTPKKPVTFLNKVKEWFE